MKSGRSLTSSTVRDERWFNGEVDDWADACLMEEEEGCVDEVEWGGMKALLGMSRTARFQKSSCRIDLLMSPQKALANGGRKRTCVPYLK